MNHDSVTREGQEMAALYALGALSQNEALAFDLHLNEGCEACQAELKQFDSVVGILGSAATPVAPPGYVRDLLAVRIEREPRPSPKLSGSVIAFPEKISATQARPAAAPSSVGRVVLPWAVAAAVMIALAYSLLAWRSDRQSLRAELDNQRSESSEIVAENQQLNEDLIKETESSRELAQINVVLRSPQWRIIQLSGLPAAPNANANVYWDVQDNHWVVTADLPPAPTGKVYQLWYVTSEAKISAGIIKPDKTGHGFAVVRVPSNASQLEAAAITLEPEGGSQQPTMPVYVLGKIS